ncbi:hypothetical protein G7Y89_g4391 [Cudoniella acicularis]|uniref:Uncharacterized protein n=1 Tax=Cudoniella acicularis TaxID=354080 RepID=A0A8H4RPJ2_9HELO|nr:hypothetical protein G7Y89_g4391 [Cudoniella acicularis]
MLIAIGMASLQYMAVDGETHILNTAGASAASRFAIQEDYQQNISVQHFRPSFPNFNPYIAIVETSYSRPLHSSTKPSFNSCHTTLIDQLIRFQHSFNGPTSVIDPHIRAPDRIIIPTHPCMRSIHRQLPHIARTTLIHHESSWGSKSYTRGQRMTGLHGVAGGKKIPDWFTWKSTSKSKDLMPGLEQSHNKHSHFYPRKSSQNFDPNPVEQPHANAYWMGGSYFPRQGPVPLGPSFTTMNPGYNDQIQLDHTESLSYPPLKDFATQDSASEFSIHQERQSIFKRAPSRQSGAELEQQPSTELSYQIAGSQVNDQTQIEHPGSEHLQMAVYPHQDPTLLFNGSGRCQNRKESEVQFWKEKSGERSRQGSPSESEFNKRPRLAMAHDGSGYQGQVHIRNSSTASRDSGYGTKRSSMQSINSTGRQSTLSVLSSASQNFVPIPECGPTDKLC